MIHRDDASQTGSGQFAIQGGLQAVIAKLAPARVCDPIVIAPSQCSQSAGPGP